MTLRAAVRADARRPITPLFLFPAETWVRFPLVPTLEGQYIIKNIVLVSAAIVLGATVRGAS